MIGLILLLSLMAAPPIPNAHEVTVVYRAIDDPNVWGVACHEDFEAVVGNRQDLCDGAPSMTAIIDVKKVRTYSQQFGKYAEIVYRYRLLELLAHEACHFKTERQSLHLPAWEAFHEEECYAEGAEYARLDRAATKGGK